MKLLFKNDLFKPRLIVLHMDDMPTHECLLTRCLVMFCFSHVPVGVNVRVKIAEASRGGSH